MSFTTQFTTLKEYFLRRFKPKKEKAIIFLYKIDGDGENFSSSLFYFLTYNVPGITIYLTIRLNVK